MRVGSLAKTLTLSQRRAIKRRFRTTNTDRLAAQ